MENATIYHVLNLCMGSLLGLYGLLESSGLGFVLLEIASVMTIAGAVYPLFFDAGSSKDISPGYVIVHAIAVLLLALGVGLSLS